MARLVLAIALLGLTAASGAQTIPRDQLASDHIVVDAARLQVDQQLLGALQAGSWPKSSLPAEVFEPAAATFLSMLDPAQLDAVQRSILDRMRAYRSRLVQPHPEAPTVAVQILYPLAQQAGALLDYAARSETIAAFLRGSAKASDGLRKCCLAQWQSAIADRSAALPRELREELGIPAVAAATVMADTELASRILLAADPYFAILTIRELDAFGKDGRELLMLAEGRDALASLALYRLELLWEDLAARDAFLLERIGDPVRGATAAALLGQMATAATIETLGALAIGEDPHVARDAVLALWISESRGRPRLAEMLADGLLGNALASELQTWFSRP